MNSHENQAKKPMGITGSWLLTNDRYIEWLNVKEPRTLWLKGFLGSGKSCLTHLVIDQVTKDLDIAGGERVVFFYCDGTDRDSLSHLQNADNILRSFLKQLCIADAKQELRQCVVNAYDRMGRDRRAVPFRDDCLTMIREILDNCTTAAFVIDGFDECPREVQMALSKSMQKIQEETISTVKIFVSGRPEVARCIEDLNAAQIDVRGNNDADIAHYIDQTVEIAAKGSSRRLYTSKDGTSSQVEHVKQVLRDNAQGMFRWCQVSLAFLHASAGYNLLTARLKQLTQLRELFKLYDATWNAIMDNLTPDEQVAIRVVILFVLYGAEYRAGDWPYESDADLIHVREGASFASFLTTGSKEQCFEIEELSNMCPSFLDGSDGEDETRLRLPHFSVREYLIQRYPEKYSHNVGHAYLAELCLDIWRHLELERSDFRDFQRYSARRWSDHLYSLDGPLVTNMAHNASLRSAIETFLLQLYCPEPFSRWSMWVEEDNSGEIIDPRTRPYSWNESLKITPPSTVFARILLGFELDCGKLHVPDEILRSVKPGRHGYPTTPIHFAAWVGNLDAIDFLVSRGIDINSEDSKGRNALHWAVEAWAYPGNRRSSRRTIEKLFEHGIDAKRTMSYTPLHEVMVFWRKRGGANSHEALRILLKHGMDPNPKPCDSESEVQTPLAMAVAESLLDACSLLFEHDADPNVRDAQGDTALHIAAWHFTSLPMFQLLIKHGADPSIKNNRDQTALELLCDRTFSTVEDVESGLVNDFLTPLTIDFITNLDIRMRHRDDRGEADERRPTTLHYLVAHCTVETVTTWVEHGADFNLKQKHGPELDEFYKYGVWMTPLDIALHYDNQPLVAYFRSLGAKTADDMGANTIPESLTSLASEVVDLDTYSSGYDSEYLGSD